jgi:PIN domain nuclease of toxin-antitoxin system
MKLLLDTHILLSAGFSILPIGSDLLASYHLLELPRDRHRDPFDRLLIWQAISSGMTLCTHDHIIRQHSLPFYHNKFQNESEKKTRKCRVCVAESS